MTTKTTSNTSFLNKIAKGEIPFYKIFWVGLLICITTGTLMTLMKLDSGIMLITMYVMYLFWYRFLWLARKNIENKSMLYVALAYIVLSNLVSIAAFF